MVSSNFATSILDEIKMHLMLQKEIKKKGKEEE
jgi:hypothetical protein